MIQHRQSFSPGERRRKAILLALALVAFALCPVRAQRPPSPDLSSGWYSAQPPVPIQSAAIELRLDVPVTQSITSAAPLRYQFTAVQGSVFRLDLDQRDLKLQVAVARPDGATLLQQTVPIHRATSIVAVANLAGSYTVTITPDQPDDRARQLSLALADIGPTNPRRASELAAAAAVKAGDDLASQWTQAAIDKAIIQYGIAASDWLQAGDKAQAASAFLRQGDMHAIRGHNKLAMTPYNEGLKALAGLAPAPLSIDLLNAMASAALVDKDQQEAETDARRAMELSRAISDEDGMGRALSEMSVVAGELQNDDHGAQAYIDQAMAIWDNVADRGGQARTLLNGSYLSSRRSAYANAFEQLTQALRLSRSLDDRYAQALILADIGNYRLHVDELEKARDSYNASLELVTQIGNAWLQPLVLDDFGFYLEAVGDPTAGQIYEKAAALLGQSGDPLTRGTIYCDLSRSSIVEGKLSLASHYAQSELEIAERMHSNPLRSQALRDIGEAYLATGSTEQALKLFTQALDQSLLGPRSAARADGGIELGRTLARLGRTKEALEAYRHSAALSHDLSLARPEAEAHYRIASFLAEDNQPEAALAEIEQAIPLVEKLRAKVSMDDTRTRWFASFHSIYTLDIDLLMQQSAAQHDAVRARHAFQIAEQSNARSFVDLLRDARIDKGVSPALQAEAASVRRLLAADTEKETTLLASRRDSSALRAVSAEIADLNARSEEIEGRLKAEDPDYFQMQVNPLSVDQVQTLLGDGDLVLEYSLAQPHSYLWAIGKHSFASYQLPSETEIEPLVRRFRQALVAPNPSLQRYLETDGPPVSEGDEPGLAAELGRMLVEPVADLSRFKRIIVVADGTLQYVPFGVLAAAGSNDAERVADSYEVINLPSMTALSVLRGRVHGNGEPTKGLVVFADPVFESDDPRIDAARIDGAGSHSPRPSPAVPGGRGVSRAHSDAGLPRLPGTRHEAELIAKAAPPASASVLLGFDASRAHASSAEIGSNDVIHFATHSVFDDEHPESSGVILSLFNRDGTPQDGYLRLRDIYDLKLSAGLVVLSACDTALGKNIRGEGIVGLTRGFMYAGAPRVVATLWRVDDDVTSEFMKYFYQAIYQHGASPAAALRQAQLEMRKQPRFRSPYYWGAFVIEGEWLPMDKSATPSAQ